MNNKAKKIIRRFRPDVVLGTGGYVCYPVLRAASARGIPTLLHEANASPGLTTRMLEKHFGKPARECRAQLYREPEQPAPAGPAQTFATEDTARDWLSSFWKVYSGTQ